MPNATLRNATDAWTNGAKPSRNYGDSRVLTVRSADQQAWLHFNRAFPLGSTVTRATLRVVYAEAWAGSRTLTVARADKSWKVSKIDHGNRPGTVGGTTTATAPAGPAGTAVEFDVKALLQTVADGGAWYGFRLVSNSATGASLGSAQGTSAYRPTLFVEWSEAPQAPTTLRPSGGAAVSVDKPTLRFDFNDVLGDTALAAVQVQIDPNANWAAPAWDSLEVATTDAELALAGTTYGGLANNASTWWRVRVKDGAGLWSEWSDDEQFTRVDLGTLTITNPAAASPVVLEPTPPFTWTYTGGTQAKWRVQLFKASDTSKALKGGDSGERTGTATAWTPPSGVLTGTGPYRVQVEVWDNVQREGVPNGADHRTQTLDFTVSEDAATTGITGLVVSQPYTDRNTVRLEWTRSTAPDSYVIRRDNEVVAEPLPGEVLLSGTTYRYEDELAAPWASHTWTVQAVVNSKQSAKSSATLTLPRARGIWLLDGARGLAVWLAGQESGSISQPEEASVFAPVGSRTVVRRVQAQRGYEGSLGGLLVDRQGLTADQSAANLTAMRAEPQRPVALVVGNLAIRVVLGNVNVAPTPQGEPPQRAATFEFWEAPA